MIRQSVIIRLVTLLFLHWSRWGTETNKQKIYITRITDCISPAILIKMVYFKQLKTLADLVKKTRRLTFTLLLSVLTAQPLSGWSKKLARKVLLLSKKPTNQSREGTTTWTYSLPNLRNSQWNSNVRLIISLLDLERVDWKRRRDGSMITWLACQTNN